MKALILGHKGQIGSALTDHLLEAGHSVVGLDLPEVDLRDVDNIPLLASEISDADVVYFLAFDVGGSTYLAKYQATVDFLSNNVRLMDNFAKAYKLSESSTPFFFASSQMSNMGWSQYGVLKRIGEFYTQALGGVNVRFWNVYGDEHDPDKFHVVTDFLKAGLSGEPIKMRTDGKEKRQMLHAADASEALEILASRYNDLDKSEYYDITSFQWVEIVEIANIVSRMCGVPYVAAETVDDVQRDSGNEPTNAITKWWYPSIGLEEGIAKVKDGMIST